MNRPVAPESSRAEVYTVDKDVVEVSSTFKFRDLGVDKPDPGLFLTVHAGCCKCEQAKTRSTLHPNSNGDQVRNKGAS